MKYSFFSCRDVACRVSTERIYKYNVKCMFVQTLRATSPYKQNAI